MVLHLNSYKQEPGGLIYRIIDLCYHKALPDLVVA